MNEKDRLVELIRDIVVPYFAEQIADHLIAHNVTIPPVSVNQTVYIIRKPQNRPAWVDKCIVDRVMIEYDSEKRICRFSGWNFIKTDEDIGKSVFLTREEAE